MRTCCCLCPCSEASIIFSLVKHPLRYADEELPLGERTSITLRRLRRPDQKESDDLWMTHQESKKCAQNHLRHLQLVDACCNRNLAHFDREVAGIRHYDCARSGSSSFSTASTGVAAFADLRLTEKTRNHATAAPVQDSTDCFMNRDQTIKRLSKRQCNDV